MIEKSVWLECGPVRAFAIFTEQATAWWPETRRHTKDPHSEIRLSAEGPFTERAADGHEVALGRVRLWEPPHRLELDFYVGTDPQHPTVVVVTFAPERDGTRVTIVHRPTPISQELWDKRAPAFERSWDAVLAGFAAACQP